MAEPRRYRIPLSAILRTGIGVALPRPRSLAADAEATLRGGGVRWETRDEHHVPEGGPFVLVGNHYERTGLWAGWGAMAASVAIRRRTGRELHWLMASEILEFHLGPWHVPPAWVGWCFARFARLYGFGLVSPRESGRGAAAVSGLRQAARFLSAGDPLAVMPEGTVSRELIDARPGVGEAIAWLTAARGRGPGTGVPIVPVGIFEDLPSGEGPSTVLVARFGAPFQLEAPDVPREERDRALGDQLMRAIAALLPEELRGPYR